MPLRYNADHMNGVNMASAPPTTMASAWPERICCTPQAMLSTPLTQPADMVPHGPRSPKWMATCVVQALGVYSAHNTGLIPRSPREK
ncbi:MAG: hypothetical protein BWY76_02533 [bacterium ADurb.Bin429]|nr:MAG: hypothetical protein BWY76_02533 [bacterium ADurb.Bin429]